MDGLAALAAGLIGLLVGLVAAFAFQVSEREQRAMPPEPEAELDSGAVEVLAVLRSATVVLRRDLEVVRASAAAHAAGLVRGDQVVHTAVRDLLTQVARDGEIRDADVELPRGPFGGATLLLQLRAAPLGLDHLLLLAEDRTESRRVEAVRRDFVVNVSHELKTPVGALSLLAETVEQAADDPEVVRRFAGRMQTETARLTTLVQEIIELSRLQVADPLRAPSTVEVDAVVHEAVDRARTAATAQGIELEVGGDAGAVVWGDHDMLVTAVRNLLDNAVAYSESGTRIGVGTAIREEAGVVEIAVVDQGIGIPAAEQPRLFERFYRVDPARSRDTGGTGLGLSIVKHVAADHGGEVTVWSEPGRGSTFTVRLPTVRPVPDTPGSPPGSSTDGAQPSAPPAEGADR
ncbi:ATP-binding protein [Actinotalea sp.]|uniref:sensor histidine kinase n=1 Tax=Actinotalea sp. TaxID=1872145 RepID=UPI002C9AD279|nr:ATP-binding protein [Actinotalea sp.]HQY32704.1 ATP-binding protein [Actinotalea sp.]HRA50777.1 ATP-binding protein [Actinotalea sp.]